MFEYNRVRIVPLPAILFILWFLFTKLVEVTTNPHEKQVTLLNFTKFHTFNDKNPGYRQDSTQELPETLYTMQEYQDTTIHIHT
jgi:hypothetical protein